MQRERSNLGPGAGKPKVRLQTCPSCATGWYHEDVDDLGRVAGYCEWCAYSVERTPLRASGHAKL